MGRGIPRFSPPWTDVLRRAERISAISVPNSSSTANGSTKRRMPIWSRCRNSSPARPVARLVLRWVSFVPAMRARSLLGRRSLCPRRLRWCCSLRHRDDRQCARQRVAARAEGGRGGGASRARHDALARARPRTGVAMFNLTIDSKLRGCDVVAVTVDDIAPNGYAIDRATVRQRKPGDQFGLS